MLQNHPSLIAPIAADAEAAFQLIERISAECDSRAAILQSIPGKFPETMDEYNEIAVSVGREALKPILVILDELSNTIIMSGSKQKRLMDMLGALGMRARKFGIRIIFAAHEFTKDMLGMIRPQCETFIAYRNDATEMSRLIGCAGAERIPQNHRGMMVTNKWGKLQGYYVDKARLEGQGQGQPLQPKEIEIVKYALEHGGEFKFREIAAAIEDTTEWSVRRLGEEWAARGWLEPGRDATSPRRVSQKLADLALTGSHASQGITGALTGSQEPLTGLSQGLTGDAQALTGLTGATA